MSKTAKLYDEIKGYYETFETEHEKNMGGNKATEVALVKLLVN